MSWVIIWCILNRYGTIDTSAPHGGIAKFEKDPVPTLQEGLQKCCPLDRNYQRLCRYFYEMVPSDDCSRANARDEGIIRYQQMIEMDHISILK